MLAMHRLAASRSVRQKEILEQGLKKALSELQGELREGRDALTHTAAEAAAQESALHTELVAGQRRLEAVRGRRAATQARLEVLKTEHQMLEEQCMELVPLDLLSREVGDARRLVQVMIGSLKDHEDCCEVLRGKTEAQRRTVDTLQTSVSQQLLEESAGLEASQRQRVGANRVLRLWRDASQHRVSVLESRLHSAKQRHARLLASRLDQVHTSKGRSHTNLELRQLQSELQTRTQTLSRSALQEEERVMREVAKGEESTVLNALRLGANRELLGILRDGARALARELGDGMRLQQGMQREFEQLLQVHAGRVCGVCLEAVRDRSLCDAEAGHRMLWKMRGMPCLPPNFARTGVMRYQFGTRTLQLCLVAEQLLVHFGNAAMEFVEFVHCFGPLEVDNKNNANVTQTRKYHTLMRMNGFCSKSYRRSIACGTGPEHSLSPWHFEHHSADDNGSYMLWGTITSATEYEFLNGQLAMCPSTSQ
eukprot:NODE_187_length_2238_cov_77.375971_g160_i0.p1 GENE.NODE_187_length_2238_cov_77.375971_g160_i0~~NODE_187_length_2238_cov_77.375971_g160_i0.p1  ORF type:complete len:481 (+),score=104.30 NODE_187_length_2238_cov_77.375971_g160_i0:762-2204(+)